VRKSLSVLVVVMFLFMSLQAVFGAESARPVGNQIFQVAVGEIVDGDIQRYIPDTYGSYSLVENMHDSNGNTFEVFPVNESFWAKAPYGATIWSGICYHEVIKRKLALHPSWTQDQSFLVYPKYSTPICTCGSQPPQPPPPPQQNGVQVSTSQQYPTMIQSGDWLILYGTGHFIQQSCQNVSQIFMSNPYTVVQVTQLGSVYTDYHNTPSQLFRNLTESQIRALYPSGTWVIWPTNNPPPPPNNGNTITVSTSQVSIQVGDYVVISNKARFIQQSCGNMSYIEKNGYYNYVVARITVTGVVYCDIGQTATIVRGVSDDYIRQNYGSFYYTSYPQGSTPDPTQTRFRQIEFLGSNTERDIAQSCITVTISSIQFRYNNGPISSFYKGSGKLYLLVDFRNPTHLIAPSGESVIIFYGYSQAEIINYMTNTSADNRTQDIYFDIHQG